MAKFLVHFSSLFSFFFFSSFLLGSVVSIMYVVTMQKGCTCIKLNMLLVILNWHILSWYAMDFVFVFSFLHFLILFCFFICLFDPFYLF